MRRKERALLAVEALKKEYPGAVCSLTYRDPLQLLIATRLSAQCTDARVNMVTPALFGRFPTLQAFTEGSPEEIEGYIHSCGLYKTKARDIYRMCCMLDSEYGGVVPDTIEELVKLPGVGRKTANLVVGDIYHKPAVVTDTHCIRICGRLGLSEGKDPLKVEKQLRSFHRRIPMIFAIGWFSMAGLSALPERQNAKSAVCGIFVDLPLRSTKRTRPKSRPNKHRIETE